MSDVTTSGVSSPLVVRLSGARSGAVAGADRGARGAALVNSREIVSRPPNSDRSNALRDAFDLAYVIRSMGLNDNLNYCLNAVAPTAERWYVQHSPSKGRARFKGLAVCGLAWLCPLCAQRVGEVRRADLEAGIAECRRLGGDVFFGTLTLRHTRWDSLQDCVDYLRGCWRKLQQGHRGARFKALLEEYGIFGFVRSLETTWGTLNSWHPHFHFLWFGRPLEAFELLRFRRRLFLLWAAVLKASGRSCSYLHGVYLTRSFGSVQDYLDKWGTVPQKRKWSSSDELTRWYRKKGRNKGFSPFELARAYGDTPESDVSTRQLYFALFSEFAAVFKGKSQLEWSRGLRDVLGLPVEASDRKALAARLASDEAELDSFVPSQFAGVRHFKRQAFLLSVADTGDRLRVRAVVDFANSQLSRCSCSSCVRRRADGDSVDVYKPEAV